VDQFIPSDLSWRSWAKMVFHQPLVPILPVARELFSKTKLIASRGSHYDGQAHISDAQRLRTENEEETANKPRLGKPWVKAFSRPQETSSLKLTSKSGMSMGYDSIGATDSNSINETIRPGSRSGSKMIRILAQRGFSRSRKSVEEIPNNVCVDFIYNPSHYDSLATAVSAPMPLHRELLISSFLMIHCSFTSILVLSHFSCKGSEFLTHGNGNRES